MAARPPARLAQQAGAALREHAPLAGLLAGHRRSQALFQIVRPALGSLAASLRPGPIEDGAWTLLTDSGAVAAKARQLLPTLIERLQSRDEPIESVRVKVLQSDQSQLQTARVRPGA